MTLAERTSPESLDLRPHVTPRRHWLAWTAVLVLVTVAVFGQVGRFEFLDWDDGLNVVHNPYLNPVTTAGMVELWRTPYAGLYVPVTYTFWALEAVVSRRLVSPELAPELDPRVFHAGNLVLHVACVLLVFVILRRLVRHDGAAAMGALLFAVHPLHVESVSWTTETKGLLSAVFALAAIWQFLCFAAPAEDTSGAQRGLHYAAATAAIGLALLSKPAAVAVPLMVLVLDVGLLRRGWRASGAALLPWFALAAVVVLITRGQQTAPPAAGEYTWWSRPLVAGDALAFYVIKLVAPVGLAPDYGRTPAVVLASAWSYVAWLLPVALAIVLALLPQRRVWLTCAALFAAGLLPVVGLMPFEYQRFSTVADRYAYLALLGPSLAVAWLLARRWSGLVVVAAVLVIASWAGLSFRQAGHWRDNSALFTRAYQVNPQSRVALVGLGNELVRQDRLYEAERYFQEATELAPPAAEAYRALAELRKQQGRLDDALALLARAVQIDPTYTKARVSRADLLLEAGAIQEAREQYVIALQSQPDYLQALRGMADVLAQQGRHAEAIGYYREVLRRGQDDAALHNNLANALAGVGRYDEAIEHYQKALEADPGHLGARRNLGLVLAATERTGAAIEPLRQALDATPDDADVSLALARALESQQSDAEAVERYRRALLLRPGWPEASADLVRLLATSHDAQVRDPQEAVRLAERAVDAEMATAEWYAAKAIAYEAADRVEDAAIAAEEALRRAAAEGNNKLRGEMRDWLEAFSRKKIAPASVLP